jgi:hypothetical protein
MMRPSRLSRPQPRASRMHATAGSRIVATCWIHTASTRVERYKKDRES